MRLPRAGLGAASFRDELFAVGGYRGDSLQSEVSLVDSMSSWGEWLIKTPLSSPRRNAAVVVLGDNLFCIGGEKKGRSVATVESYDVESKAWRKRRPLPLALSEAGAAVLGSEIFVVGGYNIERGSLDTLYSYDPKKDRWKKRAKMPSPKSRPVVGVIDGILYAAGNHALHAYDPIKDRWSFKTDMVIPGLYSGGVISGKLYALRDCWTEFFSYDPSTNRLTARAYSHLQRCSRGTAVHKGNLYVLGGMNRGLTTYPKGTQADIEIYDPSSDSWSSSAVRRDDDPKPQVKAPARTPSLVDSLPGKPAALRPADFALVVGIENYRSVPKATFGDIDAAVVADYLRHRLGVPEENVILLRGQQATRADLARQLEEWLPRNVSEESRVYFFFSGHGTADPAKGTAYLLPWDGNPKYQKSSAYSLSRLYASLQKLKAEEVVVMMDTCFSGAGGRSVIEEGLRPLVTVVAGPPEESRLVILTASKDDEVAGSIKEQGHGLFTYFLLRGLRGEADEDKDGHLRVKELHSFIQANVRREANRDNRDQTPQLYMGRRTFKLF